MSDRASRGLATFLAIAALAMEAVAIVLAVPNAAKVGLAQVDFNMVFIAVIGATYPILGWLIATRRRRNRIGWMFLVVAMSMTGTACAGMYASYGLVTAPGTMPLAGVAAWVGTWSWVPGLLVFMLIFLAFPDGSLPSRRWRPLLMLAAVAGFLAAVPGAIASWTYRGPDLLTGVPSADGAAPLQALLLTTANLAPILVFPVAIGSVAGMVGRFRRARTVERQQIKWFAVAGIVTVAVVMVASGNVVPYPVNVLLAVLVAPLVPIATAVAILRYRLFEIDRIISRTVGWAASTGIVIAMFGAGLVVLETLLAGLTQGSTLAVAGSTLAAFAAFQPVRRRVQSVVDHRFDRSRYDAARTADGFEARLRGEVDLNTVAVELVAVAARALRPDGTELWLRSRP